MSDLRASIARFLTEQADRMLQQSSQWPDRPVVELPRAAVEEAAAILNDCASELKASRRRARVKV